MPQFGVELCLVLSSLSNFSRQVVDEFKGGQFVLVVDRVHGAGEHTFRAHGRAFGLGNLLNNTEKFGHEIQHLIE